MLGSVSIATSACHWHTVDRDDLQADARKRGDPLMCSDGTEVELERIILVGVEVISKGGIMVALDFAQRY